MRWFAVWLWCLSVACVESNSVQCGELLCPRGNVCTADGCASPADVAACNGIENGEACLPASGTVGICQGGACRTGLCGNSAVDIGEVCDDGNQMSADGCRADCRKIERCGDAELDSGEACDDGNANPADSCDQCRATAWNATAIVGSAVGATTAGGSVRPAGVAVDGLGRVFIVDSENHRIRRVDPSGNITTIAGIGTAGYDGDGGQATSAQLSSPGAIAVDGLGRVFIADSGNHRIRRIDIDGTIRTIAGIGSAGASGDGGPATSAQLSGPRGVAIDGFGRVVIADRLNYKVRLVETDGTITTVAGTGVPGSSLDGIAATNALLHSPAAVAVDSLGRIAIAEVDDHRVRRIELDGTLVTVAGTSVPGFSGDGGAATSALLFLPFGVAVDAQDRIVIADSGNHHIRRVELDGTIHSLAGIGGFGDNGGFNGDGGLATSAQLQFPVGIAFDGSERTLIADTLNLRIRRIETNGAISTVVGTGTPGAPGDGRAATSAPLANPSAVAIDRLGRWIIADSGYPGVGPFNNSVRRIEIDGTITTIAGQASSYGFVGDGGLANAALLSTPMGVAVDGSDRILIADTHNHAVRRVDSQGIITTIAGIGTVPGYGGDLGPANSATLREPHGLAVDVPGRVMIADTENHVIRRVQIDGTIRTIAGTGVAGYSGDGLLATSAQLSRPVGVVVDSVGRVVIADTGNHVVRRIELDATIAKIAGTGTAGYSGDGSDAKLAQLSSPTSIAFDAAGRLVIADSGNHALRRVETNGTITTIAGVAGAGSRGDGGSAIMAALHRPTGIAVDRAGTIGIADSGNNRIRSLAGNGTLLTIAGAIDPADTGPTTVARLATPQGLQVDPEFTFVAGGASGTVEAILNGRVVAVSGRYPQTSATGVLARFRDGSFGAVGGVAYDAVGGVVYVSETSANRIFAVTLVDRANPATWTLAPVANAAAIAGFADGPSATARFRSPSGLFLDPASRILYIADSGNHAVRALDLATMTVTTLVNASHRLGLAGDGGPAKTALLFSPSAITRCANGDVFVADTGNHRVRRVTPSGIISTVIGDGTPASSGEGTPANSFPVNTPRGLACDPFGNLFVSSSTTIRMVAANDAGIVDGSGAVDTIYGALRIAFPESITSCLTGIAVTSSSTIQAADACSGLLIAVARQTR